MARRESEGTLSAGCSSSLRARISALLSHAHKELKARATTRAGRMRWRRSAAGVAYKQALGTLHVARADAFYGRCTSARHQLRLAVRQLRAARKAR